MDNRLRRRGGKGRRIPSQLLDVDLPELAWAITALVRGQAHLSNAAPKHEKFVRIQTTTGLDVTVRRSDWVKIQPLLVDGTFSPKLFPVESGSQVLDRVTRYHPALLPTSDPLYDRVLLYLRELFPTQVPTQGPN